MPGEWETGFTTPERAAFYALAVAFRGKFHGPKVETLSISEEDFYRMLSALLTVATDYIGTGYFHGQEAMREAIIEFITFDADRLGRT